MTLTPQGVSAATEHTVVGGDYLDKIARTHGTSWQNVHNANPHIENPHLIYVGDKVAIPQGEVAPTKPVEAPQPAPAPEPVHETAPAPAPVVEAPVAPQPAPAPAPAYGGSDCEVARNLINQYDWNKDVAYQVMLAESNCNPMAANWNDQHANCTGSFGLFQINCGHGQLYDPAANVSQAYRMYSASGWQPWGFTTCAVKVSCY